MDGLIFLAIAIGVSLVGAFLLWLRTRERRSFHSSIDDFKANMGALAPPDRERRGR